jgi:hypothetical protein
MRQETTDFYFIVRFLKMTIQMKLPMMHAGFNCVGFLAEPLSPVTDANICGLRFLGAISLSSSPFGPMSDMERR